MKQEDIQQGQTVEIAVKGFPIMRAYVRVKDSHSLTIADAQNGAEWCIDYPVKNPESWTFVGGRLGRRIVNEYRESNPKIDILSRDENGAIKYHGSTNFFSHVGDAVKHAAANWTNTKGASKIFGRIDKSRPN